MTRSKTLDQLFLLIAALIFIVVMEGLISFFDARHISEKMGFFLLMNGGAILIIMWQGISGFRRTQGFWSLQTIWIGIHIRVCLLWARSGRGLELVVLTMPLEIYCYLQISKRRLLRDLDILRD